MSRPSHPIDDRPYESLAAEAVSALADVSDGVKSWTDSVRDENSARFLWARETTRAANVAASAYTLAGLRKIGIYDSVITPEDKKKGVEWVRSLAVGDGRYRDPALLDRKPPGWPDEKPWPDSGILECNSRYSQTVLREYGSPDPVSSPPPPGWPQRDDDPQDMVRWIKARPWHESSWSSGSWTAKMMRYMLDWHLEGVLPIDPLIESLRYLYSIQDPASGLWGAPALPVQNRINGTFKLFGFIRNQLDLPLRYPEAMIDQVMDRFYDPSYDENVGGCDEFDNWYVILHALPQTNEYRRDEIRRMAAYRIKALLGTFTKPDGGISFNPGYCQTSWVGIDMAPRLAQGDAMGLGLITSGVCTCVELCGLVDAATWQGMPRDTKAYSDDIRSEIIDRAEL